MEYKLTHSQEIALAKVTERIHNPNRKQLFKLYGSAGTGKSFLINVIVNTILLQLFSEDEIAFCAPTGKAASVLIQRFEFENISTIHKLIYHTEVVKEPILFDEDNNPVKYKETIKFHRKSNLGNIQIIIVDEFSMVDKEILTDLMNYNLPMIVLGDPYQLPPINGQHISISDCDAILTEIVRQSEENQIVNIANNIKNGGILKYGNFNNQVIVLNKHYIKQSELINILTSADQVICGLNRTKNKTNSLIRQYKNINSVYPVKGDKLICKLNNYCIDFDKYTLANGLIGYCTEYTELQDNIGLLNFRPDFYAIPIEYIPVDSGIFSNDEYKYPLRQLAYNMGNNTFKSKINLTKYDKKADIDKYHELASEEFENKISSISTEMLNRFEFGYCISCHASQGSEFNTVAVIDESFAFKDCKKEWLYTAITRAKQKVIIIR